MFLHTTDMFSFVCIYAEIYIAKFVLAIGQILF